MDIGTVVSVAVIASAWCYIRLAGWLGRPHLPIVVSTLTSSPMFGQIIQSHLPSMVWHTERSWPQLSEEVGVGPNREAHNIFHFHIGSPSAHIHPHASSLNNYLNTTANCWPFRVYRLWIPSCMLCPR